MQTSLNTLSQAPLGKVKNILIRHSCSKRVEFNNYQHPETPYILKYAPKYYKSLILQATCQSPLSSKVKKIKKLKTFTGYFNKHLPQKLWFNLLGNTRKEIEEVPQMSPNNATIKSKELFWMKLNQQKLKHFWNVTRIWLPKWRGSYLIHDLDNLLSSKELFVKHVWNLRKLKSLKIMVKYDNYDGIRWFLGKLNRMNRLFERLEILNLHVINKYGDIPGFLQYKNFFFHLTGLKLSLNFDPIYAEIPQISKNLTCLCLDFQKNVDEKPEFWGFLTSVRQLTQLKRLEFSWPSDQKDFWSHLKPQTSLQHFLLRFGSHDLINAGFFEEEGKIKDVVGHWEEIEALKTLELHIFCKTVEDFNLVKLFATKVLKKVRKLETLKISVGTRLETKGPKKNYDPFVLEDVPHLYPSLERFKYQFYSWTQDRSAKLDLKFLKPFKKLKFFQLKGNIIEDGDNLEEIVSLLEENQKEEEFPVLKFDLMRSVDLPADWLRNILGMLERTKRTDRNLQVMIDLTFGLEGYMESLESLCKAIQSAKKIRCLKIGLNFTDDDNYYQWLINDVSELLSKYPGLRNLKVMVSNAVGSLEFSKVDGEKDQLSLNEY